MVLVVPCCRKIVSIIFQPLENVSVKILVPGNGREIWLSRSVGTLPECAAPKLNGVLLWSHIELEKSYFFKSELF